MYLLLIFLPLFRSHDDLSVLTIFIKKRNFFSSFDLRIVRRFFPDITFFFFLLYATISNILDVLSACCCLIITKIFHRLWFRVISTADKSGATVKCMTVVDILAVAVRNGIQCHLGANQTRLLINFENFRWNFSCSYIDGNYF